MSGLMERFNNSKVDLNLLGKVAIGGVLTAIVLQSVITHRKDQYKRITEQKNSDTYDVISEYVRSGRRG